MKKIIFDSGTEFTIQKPSVKEFIKLFDLYEQGTSSAMLLDEILKHITYPSKEEARKFLTKYVGSIYGYLFKIIKVMCGEEIVDSPETVVEETEDDKIKIVINGKTFYFRRLNFAETDLVVRELKEKNTLSANLCHKITMMTVCKSKDNEVDYKALLDELFIEYPLAVVAMGREIFNKCSMKAEINLGE